ncbi:MAG: PD40 domain-containing protein [Phycisphaerales bacterium]|nr:MAG: PD40 domain-containing protein [Phycisphaerales bacterium]
MITTESRRFCQICCFCIILLGLDGFAQEKPAVLKGEYLGMETPERSPLLFAPAVVSTGNHEHSAPTFSPDGREIYWSVFRDVNQPQLIMCMKRADDVWTRPMIAPFSGQYSDGGPFISPDGRRLFFYSDRPAQQDGVLTKDFDLWFVERRGEQWGDPVHLGLTVNSAWDEFSPSVSKTGTLYFHSDRPGGFGKFDIYSSQMRAGQYLEPRNLGATVNSSGQESYPYIGPDESYLIFTASERGKTFGLGDLFVSVRKKNGVLSEARNAGRIVNDEFDNRFPLVSHDGKFLFFVSNRSYRKADDPGANRGPGNGLGDIYWVSAETIEELRE